MSETSAYHRVELGPLAAWDGKHFTAEALALTGTEISFNRFPAGAQMPFVHAHRLNEEVYIVLQGGGRFYLDGEESAVQEGTVLRVSPPVKRAWIAGDQGMTFLCVQAQAHSLTQATKGDGTRFPELLPSWMKPLA